MVQRLLSGKRDGANPDYEKAAFERTLEEQFTVERSERGHRARARSTRLARGDERLDRRRAGRAPSRRAVGAGVRAAAVRPARATTRSSSSRAGARAATSCCSRSATRSLPPLAGRRARVGARPRSGRARAGRQCSCSSRCSWPRCCCRRSATRSAARPGAIAVALAAGAGARGALRPSRRRAVVRDACSRRAARSCSLLFLVVSPVRELLLPGRRRRRLRRGPPRSSTPIVHIVLDELPEDTRRPGGRADRREAVPEPRAASRATPPGTATPRRSTTSRRRRCRRSSPASSRSRATCRPRATTRATCSRCSSAATMLVVVEPITDLCPERLCGKRPAGTVDRLRVAASRTSRSSSEHLLLPADLREGLPAVDRVWEGFETRARRRATCRGGANLRRDMLDAARRATTRRRASSARSRALDAPAARGRRSCSSTRRCPTGRGAILPDGRQYPIAPQGLPGARARGWIGPQWQVDQAFQRHVLQTAVRRPPASAACSTSSAPQGSTTAR